MHLYVMVRIVQPQSTASSATRAAFVRPGPVDVSSLDASLPSVPVDVASPRPAAGATEHTVQTQEDICTNAQAKKLRETHQGALD